MKDVWTRFFEKVEVSEDGCWNWTAGRFSQGYGCFKFQGKDQGSHRVSWTLFNGPLPIGKERHDVCVLHKCDNKACVNPAHLSVGTQADNMLDMDRKGRRAVLVGEDRGGSKLTAEGVAKIRDMLAKGVPQRVVAEEFGVGQMTVSNIHTGTTWSHVK